ncbi:DUF4440 domain-containing protein [Sphingopyxis sp. R3-92]|uniref:DUF4440 domain-containing protein n=1 Tax=Sphingopyxis sp. R3-92 TaxID=3158553 RepID=UPI003EE5088A
MPLTLFLAAALGASTPAPMPTGEALTAQITTNDARLFWAVFEGCDAKALPDLLAPEFRMIHDKGGLAAASRDAMIADVAKGCASRQPGGAQVGYRNRRLLVPGSHRVRAMGDWGALEEGAHVFFEWNARDARWDMVGGAHYMHLWQWMPAEARFRLSQSYSYDHDGAAAYPPVSVP